MKNICAIWDIQKAGSGLGSLLLFQEELLLYREILKFEGIDLFFLTGSKKVSFSYLASIAQLNPFIQSIHILKDIGNIRNDQIQQGCFLWPSTKIDEKFSYQESTLHIQTLWKQKGNLIAFECPPDVKEKAVSWMQSHIPSECYPVSIHLKNSTQNKQSNANQAEWLKFFKDCRYKELPVIFILIGDDPYDTSFGDCPNCIITKNHGGSLELDLSLVQNSLFFMGMSSGPCNIAILSELPYLIWKNPDHHAKEMARELNKNGQFPFSNDRQMLLRQNDCFENIVDHFTGLFNKMKKFNKREKLFI